MRSLTVLRRLSALLILLLAATITLSAQETKNDEPLVPKLEIPEPPSPQEGDEEIVTVTVGHMRNALYYYRLLPIVIDYAEGVSAVAIAQADKTDKTLQSLYEQEEQTYRWKKRTVISSATAALFLTTTLALFLR